MNYIKKLFCQIFFILTACFAFGQNCDSVFFNFKPIRTEDNGKIFVGLENTNILKNNEYFNYYISGYTLIGFMLRPSLIYYPSSNTRISGGVHLLKYSGLDHFSQAQPILTFQYNFAKGFDVVLGTLYGTVNHGLAEPLFGFDRYVENNVENGLQFLVDKNYLRSDTWLNWEQFIQKDDPFKEIFTAGTSNNIYITGHDSPFQFSIPLQAVITHRGGQYESSDEKLQTLANSATGLEIGYSFNRFVKAVGLKSYFLTYNDWSGYKQLHYNNGYALYPNFYLATRYGSFTCGYYHGHQYIAGRGDQNFQSVSLIYKSQKDPERRLITAKLIFQKTVAKDIKLGIRFESYYDPMFKQFDYSYGIHIVFNRDFFLVKV